MTWSNPELLDAIDATEVEATFVVDAPTASIYMGPPRMLPSFDGTILSATAAE